MSADALRPRPRALRAARTRARPRPLGALVGGVLALLAAGCASLDQDRDLAPIYSQHSVAGGGERIEALGGMLVRRRDVLDGPVRFAGARPLYLQDKPVGGARTTDFLTPFGRARETENDYTWRLAPIARFSRRRDPEGGTSWSWISLPGFYFAGFPDGRASRAWFPIAGHVKGLMTWEELTFVLWPLYVRAEHADYTNFHVLYPVLGWTRGEGASGWHLWPLYGRKTLHGIADRWYLLWPFYQHHHDNLKASRELHEHHWMLWPLLGVTRQDTRVAYMFLWPFFGWARDPRTGFWALDAPWPLVRLQRSGEERGIRRTRLWPFWSHYAYEREGIESTWWLWPFFNRREEDYYSAQKRGTVLIPFYQDWEREDEANGRERFFKVWPFYQQYDTEAGRTWSTPVLNPLWRFPRLERAWDWIYQLYTRETDEEIVRERAWLGLYRREKDAHEDRRYLSILWSNRRYRRDGEPISETSVLFGLLRWRSGPSDSLELLRPAVPGPGWPLERARGPVDPDLLPAPEEHAR